MFAADSLDRILDERSRWETETLEPTLDRFGERDARFATDSGTDIDRLYTPADTPERAYDDLGFPGEPPFTRGIHSTMYRGRLWTMRQYAGFGTAAETNDRFRQLMADGSTGLSLAFDLPTQLGYDSDHAMAAGEVGKNGVAIDTLADMERVFDGIPLDEASTSMTINAPAAVLLAMYVACADRQGADRSALRGTLQNDVLKEYIARNNYIYPPGPSMRLATDVMAFCADELPEFNPISVSGYHVREQGATAPQEVAFTLGNGLAYLEAASEAGLSVADVAPRVSFFFAAHNDLLEEVAKFRAARRLWARLIRDRFGIDDPAARKLRFHVQTAGSTLTAQQPENNVVRVAYQALAAVLGGAQSLHTNGKDEALGLPTEESVRTALRTQQILAHETGVAHTPDPLGGSFYVESLTDEVEAEARDLLDDIDDRGGMRAAIESGWVKRRIEDEAYEREQAKEAGERIVVGENAFESDDDPAVDVESVDSALQEQQRERLTAHRDERDDERVEAGLVSVRDAAAGDGNLVPPMIDAVKHGATVGEISDALRDEFGEYEPR
jgi:methylmalonyl-CoA mutase N-terminal domain/subunit